jgi:lysyl-tRNA synthetase class 2
LKGINPYPASYKRSHTSTTATALLNQQESSCAEAAEINLAGRITALRRMGKISFANLMDGSGKLQLFFRLDNLEEPALELFKDLDVGDIVGVTGSMFRTKTGEPTLQVTGLTLLCKAFEPLPEKWHGLTDVETRYRQRYLDLISNPAVKNVFLSRSKIISSIREFMAQKGYVEVETPVLHATAGGALAKPFITHHHSLDRDLYLRIALELPLKRLIVGGFDKVYELGRIFRNEGISTRHNPEFTMMESYEAYADYKDIMALVEEMLSTVVMRVTGSYQVHYGDTLLDFTLPGAAGAERGTGRNQRH